MPQDILARSGAFTGYGIVGSKPGIGNVSSVRKIIHYINRFMRANATNNASATSTRRRCFVDLTLHDIGRQCSDNETIKHLIRWCSFSVTNSGIHSPPGENCSDYDSNRNCLLEGRAGGLLAAGHVCSVLPDFFM